MPLPSDEKLLALSQSILTQFDTIFGLHPGFRPAHAKGILATGTFTPAPDAATLTNAAHITATSTPISIRFSNSTGIPVIPDTDPNANPRGIGIRFQLGERIHTDIVGHSVDAFPTRTGEEFLEFLKAIASTTPDASHPNPVEAFLGSYPAALAFVQAPKPFPSSFGRETYFGVTAMHFTNAAGETRFGRYQVIPEAGNDFVDEAAVATKSPEYLFDELAERLARDPITFRLQVQLADTGDVVDDATIHWPAERTLFPLGTLALTAIGENNPADQKYIIFDPIPRLQGIAPSDDPLLELRAALYLISGRRRRTAPQ